MIVTCVGIVVTLTVAVLAFKIEQRVRRRGIIYRRLEKYGMPVPDQLWIEQYLRK